MNEDYTQEQLPYQNLSLEDMEGEAWGDIRGYEGLYRISNMGRIKSLARQGRGNKMAQDCILIQAVKERRYGYKTLEIVLHNKNYKNYLVHRLVADAFLQNPNNYPEIDHIDGNPSNNRVDNLRCCDRKQNMANPITVIRLAKARKEISQRAEYIQKQRQCQPHSKRIAIYDGDVLVQTFISQSETARFLDVSVQAVCAARKYERKCKGYQIKNI